MGSTRGSHFVFGALIFTTEVLSHSCCPRAPDHPDPPNTHAYLPTQPKAFWVLLMKYGTLGLAYWHVGFLVCFWPFLRFDNGRVEGGTDISKGIKRSGGILWNSFFQLMLIVFHSVLTVIPACFRR